jgi:hypothetical protein
VNVPRIVCMSDYVRHGHGIQFLALASFEEMKLFGVRINWMICRLGAGGNSL